MCSDRSVILFLIIFKHKHLLDFSKYLKDSKFFDETNGKVIGKMKDKSERKTNDEFVGLKSKMYSIKNIDGKECNAAEGVNIATEFNEFKNIFFNKKIRRYKMRGIQAKNHKLGTYEINKISLSCFDGKRFILNEGIHTLAYFHKDLKSRFLQIKNLKKFSQIKKIRKIFVDDI